MGSLTAIADAGSEARPSVGAALGYRADVDGLRAVAILLVLLFHAFPYALPGGFVGVDVFFTISGYLISGIVIAGLQVGSFSVLEFYARRVRRIFPALIVVLAATFGAGWLFMLPDEFKQLGKHIAAGALYALNLTLLTEAGYFDTASELKPLMHLWSLSIEEQFYLCYPLLLVWAWRRRINLLGTIATLAGGSFLLNLRHVAVDPVGAFFWPHTRVWELLVGAGLACLHLREGHAQRALSGRVDSRVARGGALAALGMLLILTSAALFHESDAFPGWRALVPVLGAAMVLHAGPHAWLNRRVLAARPMVLIGLISYPLYLWHWPLLSMARVRRGETPSDEVSLALLLASFVLAWLTYVAIEQPVRFGRWRGAAVTWLVACLALVGLAGAWAYARDGVAERAYPQAVEEFYTSLRMGDPRSARCFDLVHAYRRTDGWFCSFGPADAAPTLFAYGDSHALSLLPAIDRHARERERRALFAGSSGCPPLLGIQSLRGAAAMEKHDCHRLNERIFSFVRDNGIRQVLLVARWSYYAGGAVRPEEFNPIAMVGSSEASVEASHRAFVLGLDETVARYRAIGVQVILVHGTPLQAIDPRVALKRSGDMLSLPRPSLAQINVPSVTTAQHVAHQARATAALRRLGQPMVSLVSFDDTLCPGDQCPLATKDGFLYFDHDHLSVVGAESVYPTLAQALTATEVRPVRH